jgi:lysophospholipase L1-like esterase
MSKNKDTMARTLANKANTQLANYTKQIEQSLTNKGCLFKTFLSTNETLPMTDSSAFHGFATRLSYSGESIRAVNILLSFDKTLANKDVLVNVELRKSNFSTVIASKQSLQKHNKWTLFDFGTTITTSNIPDGVFYLVVYLVDRSGGANFSIVPNYPTIANVGTKVINDNGKGNRYLQGLTNGNWMEMNSKNYSIPAYFVSSNQILLNNISPIQLDGDLNDSKLAVPSKIYALENQECNIYLDNIVSNSRYDHYFNVNLLKGTTSIGKQQDERFTYVPATADVGSYNLSLYSYDRHFNYLDSKFPTLIVTSAGAKNGQTLKCLFIGDSITADPNSYVKQLKDVYSTDVLQLTMIGTKGATGYKNEGVAGSTVAWHYSNASSSFVINGTFNFPQYMANNSLGGVDVVGISLGINDVSWMEVAAVDAQFKLNAIMLDAMIASIKSYNSNAIIAIALPIPVATHQDAFGDQLQTGTTQWTAKRAIHRYCQNLISYYSGKELTDKIYLVPINVSIDCENNFSTTTVAVNARNTATVTRQNNHFHPPVAGHQQMADAWFTFLKSIKDAVTLSNVLSTDGNFQTDTSSDGLGDGWSNSSSVGLSMSNNIQSFTPNAQYSGIYKTITKTTSWVETDKLYCCAWVKSDKTTVSLALQDSDGNPIQSAIHSGSGNFEFLSALLTTVAGQTTLWAKIGSSATSGWTQVQLKQVYVFNLTSIFGAGKEPSKATMDAYMSAQTDYFTSKQAII